MTTTQVSGSISLSDPNRFPTFSTDHVLDKNNQITIFNQGQRLDQAIPVQQPSNGPSNIKVINAKMTRPVRLHGNNSTSEFSTLNSVHDTRNRQESTPTHQPLQNHPERRNPRWWWWCGPVCSAHVSVDMSAQDAANCGDRVPVDTTPGPAPCVQALKKLPIIPAVEADNWNRSLRHHSDVHNVR